MVNAYDVAVTPAKTVFADGSGAGFLKAASATAGQYTTESQIATADIADNAVTPPKLALASTATTGVKLNAADILSPNGETELAHYTGVTVDTASIDDSAVTTAKVADGAITNDKLSDEVKNAIAAAGGSVTGTDSTATAIAAGTEATFTIPAGAWYRVSLSTSVNVSTWVVAGTDSDTVHVVNNSNTATNATVRSYVFA